MRRINFPGSIVPRVRRAFTLVEILIVVVILGILAAIVTPQFASATSQAQEVATLDQLSKLRRALAMYYANNASTWPNVTAGNGTWGELLSGGFMREAPVNSWIGAGNSKAIILGNTPDTAWQTTHAWIFDPATGNVWAGGFDAEDVAHPR
jgi:general secretion pathway protein G